MVKPGWESSTIGALIERKQASIQTGPFGTVLSASEYVEHGIPIVSVREICQGRIELFDETPAVSDITYRKLSQFNLLPYDIVFARKGSVDRSALVPCGSPKLFLGSDGIRLRFTSRILAQIVFHILQSFQVKQYLAISAYGTTLAGLNEAIISGVPVNFPESPTEQQRIAEALSDMDELIASLEKLIAKKKAIKQGAMQELLTGKRHLPGFSGEWVEYTVEDVAVFCTAAIPTSWINLRHYIGTDNMLANREGIRDNTIAIPYVVVREYREGDILLSNIRPYLKKIWLADKAGGCSNDVFVIRSRDNRTVLPTFLFYLLSMDAFFDEVMASAVGTKMPRGDKNIIKEYQITVPFDSNEQQAIVSILSSMDHETKKLKERLEKAHQIKHGMMQRLLTGKIRLL